jgi:hypothetical protein
VAVIEYLLPDSGHPAPGAALLGLHYYLTSTAATYRMKDLRDWLADAGFEPPRATPIRRLPLQTLVVARRPRRG